MNSIFRDDSEMTVEDLMKACSPPQEDGNTKTTNPSPENGDGQPSPVDRVCECLERLTVQMTIQNKNMTDIISRLSYLDHLLDPARDRERGYRGLTSSRTKELNKNIHKSKDRVAGTKERTGSGPDTNTDSGEGKGGRAGKSSSPSCNEYGSQYISSTVTSKINPVDHSVDGISKKIIEHNDGKFVNSMGDERLQNSMDVCSSMAVSRIEAVGKTGPKIFRDTDTVISMDDESPLPPRRNIATRSVTKAFSNMSAVTNPSLDPDKEFLLSKVLKTKGSMISFMITSIINGITEYVRRDYDMEQCGFEDLFRYIGVSVRGLIDSDAKIYNSNVIGSFCSYIKNTILKSDTCSRFPTEYRMTPASCKNVLDGIHNTDLFKKMLISVCKVISRLPIYIHPTICTITEYVCRHKNIVGEDETGNCRYRIDIEEIKLIHTEYQSICVNSPYSGYYEKHDIVGSIMENTKKKNDRDLYIKLMSQLVSIYAPKNEKMDSDILLRHVICFSVILCYTELKGASFSKLSTNLSGELTRYSFYVLSEKVRLGRIKDSRIKDTVEYSKNILLSMRNKSDETKLAIMNLKSQS